MKTIFILVLVFVAHFSFSQNIEELEQKAMEVNYAYKRYIEQADSCFRLKDYKSAIIGYQSALILKCNEVYPMNKIVEIEHIFKNLSGSE